MLRSAFRSAAGGAALALLAPVAPIASPAAPTPSPTETAIAERLREFPGVVGVAAIDLASGETIAVNADARFPTASLIKVPVMVEVFHQIAEGKLRLDERVTLREEDKAGDEPVVLNQMGPGLQPSIADLLSLMIAYSDNTAANLLIARVGTAAVDRRLDSYGLRDTRLFRPLFRDGHADLLPELEAEYGLGMTTPREMAKLFALIAEGKVVGREASERMVALLDRQQFREMIPRSLPFGRDDVRVANKTGWDEEKTVDAGGVRGQIRTDAAYVRSDRARYVIAICARRVRDDDWGVDNVALRVGAEISRAVYDHFAAGR